jgi:DNA polymerase-3 subunit alpha
MIKAVKATIPEDPALVMRDLLDNPKYIQALQSVAFPDTMVTVNQANINKIMNSSRVTYIDQADIPKLNMVQNGTMSDCQIMVKSSWTWEKALNIMLRLDKLNKHESTHAGGVVVAPVVLEENVPLMQRDGDGVLACQYDMRSLEELGYLKMDALGLRTVDVNHETSRLIRQWHDPEFDQDAIPLDDQNAIDLIRRGDTIGIFQVESSGFTQMMIDIFKSDSWMEKMEDAIDDFMWISAGLAMYRPGPLDAVIEGKTMVQHLIDRKGGKEPVIYLFPEEEQYLKETYGVMIYQEQVMSRARQMTGCTMGKADALRKVMGKKDPVEMGHMMDWFEETAMAHQFTLAPITDDRKRGIVQRAREEITKFARYGFNKAHRQVCAPMVTWVK